MVREFFPGSRPSAWPVPVLAGRAKVTKLPWIIDAGLLSRATGIPCVRVLNDFAAAAFGVSYLKPRHLVALRAGTEERCGPIALIGAGTGLGTGRARLIRGALRAPSLGG